MPDRNPDVIVIAFYQRWLADRRAGREHDLAHYQRQFPGYEQVLAAEVAALADDDTISTAPPGVLRQGDDFAGYRIERVLGQGGQAIVYLAHQLDPPRPIALKILLDSRAWSTAARARFEREVALTARLQHPGICPVFDRGNERGLPWLTMPALRGAPLSSRMAEIAARPWQEAIRVLRAAADAVAYAHAQGVVHRDLKPGNLWLDPEGRVVVLDFGLAIELGDAATSLSPTLTRSGDRFGTPGYMAPEQLAGAPSTRHTDVFALGVVLYELLTGEQPYPTVTLAGYERSVAAGPPDPRRRRRGLPRDLSAVIAVACAPDVNERYRDAAALRDDLDAVSSHRSIAATPPSLLRRLRRWMRREPALAGSLAALLAVLIGGVLTTWMALERSQRNAARSALTAAASMLQERQVDAARAALAACPEGHGGFLRRLLTAELDAGSECTIEPPAVPTLTRSDERFVVQDGDVSFAFDAPAATLRAFAASQTAGVAALALTERGTPGSVVMIQQHGGGAPRRIEMPDAGVLDLSIAPDSGWLWCVARPLGVIRRQRLEAWSVRSGDRLWGREISDGRSAHLLALPGHRAVLGWPDGAVQLVHADERPDEHLFWHHHPIEGINHHATGFVTTDTSGARRWWAAEPRGTRRRLVTGTEAVIALAFNDHLHITTGIDRAFTWDLDHDVPLQAMATARPQMSAAAGPATVYHPHDSLRAIAQPDGSVQLRDVATDTVLATLTSGSAAITTLAFSPDGEQLAIGHDDGLVTVFDARGWPSGSPERADAMAQALQQLRTVGHEASLDVAWASPPSWRSLAQRSLQRRRAGWVSDELAISIAMPFAPPQLHRFALAQVEQLAASRAAPDPKLLPSLVVGQLRIGSIDLARALVDAAAPLGSQTAQLLRGLVSMLDEGCGSADIPAPLAESPLGAELSLRADPAHRSALDWLIRTMRQGGSLRDMRSSDWRDAPMELRRSLRELFTLQDWRKHELTQALHRLLVRPLPTEVHLAAADLMLGVQHGTTHDRRTRASLAAAMLRAGQATEAHAALTALATESTEWQRLEFEVAAWLALAEHLTGRAAALAWLDRAEAIALATGQANLLDRRLLVAELRDTLR